jgi:hypothetical protein
VEFDILWLDHQISVLTVDYYGRTGKRLLIFDRATSVLLQLGRGIDAAHVAALTRTASIERPPSRQSEHLSLSGQHIHVIFRV